MPTRTDLIKVARTWIDTPTRPSGSERCGVNCFGLFIGILRELGGFEDAIKEAQQHLGFKVPEKRSSLLHQLSNSKYLKMTPRPFKLDPGNILLLFTRGGPQHIALVTEPGIILHAAQSKKKVIEHRIPDGWRVAAEFELVGLSD
jgi:cell wall-associated NlpC family hydrolase